MRLVIFFKKLVIKLPTLSYTKGCEEDESYTKDNTDTKSALFFFK